MIIILVSEMHREAKKREKERKHGKNMLMLKNHLITYVIVGFSRAYLLCCCSHCLKIANN